MFVCLFVSLLRWLACLRVFACLLGVFVVCLLACVKLTDWSRVCMFDCLAAWWFVWLIAHAFLCSISMFASLFV